MFTKYTLYRKNRISFYDKSNKLLFTAYLWNVFTTLYDKLIISAASSLYNPVGLRTIMHSETVTLRSTAVPLHMRKEAIIEALDYITHEYQTLIKNIPYGLYEYQGIRIVHSPEEYHKVTENDVIDMVSLDPTILDRVKRATTLVHAFITLQTDEHFPDWLKEDLEKVEAAKMLES